MGSRSLRTLTILLRSQPGSPPLLPATEATPDGPTPGQAAKVASADLPKFIIVKGIAAPFSEANIDTDQILPKQYLKTLVRTGLGAAFFHDVRFDTATGKEIPDFILNQEPHRRSSLLICDRANFGCGSAREHAPWALMDFGIRCIIAPSLGEIFTIKWVHPLFFAIYTPRLMMIAS